MDVMLGYCFVHTCKGLVELAISLLQSIDPWMSCWDIALCIHVKGMVELAISFAISLLGIDHGCHVGILLCAYM